MEFSDALFDDDAVQKKLILNLCNFFKKFPSCELFSAFWNIVTGIKVRFYFYWSFTIIIQCSIDSLKWFPMVAHQLYNDSVQNNLILLFKTS